MSQKFNNSDTVFRFISDNESAFKSPLSVIIFFILNFELGLKDFEATFLVLLISSVFQLNDELKTCFVSGLEPIIDSNSFESL